MCLLAAPDRDDIDSAAYSRTPCPADRRGHRVHPDAPRTPECPGRRPGPAGQPCLLVGARKSCVPTAAGSARGRASRQSSASSCPSLGRPATRRP